MKAVNIFDQLQTNKISLLLWLIQLLPQALLISLAAPMHMPQTRSEDEKMRARF